MAPFSALQVANSGSITKIIFYKTGVERKADFVVRFLAEVCSDRKYLSIHI